jgi:hypothetical protein
LLRHLGADLAADTQLAEFLVGLPAVPGSNPRRLCVVAALSPSEVSLWEFDGQRTFDRRHATFC